MSEQGFWRRILEKNRNACSGGVQGCSFYSGGVQGCSGVHGTGPGDARGSWRCRTSKKRTVCLSRLGFMVASLDMLWGEGLDGHLFSAHRIAAWAAHCLEETGGPPAERSHILPCFTYTHFTGSKFFHTNNPAYMTLGCMHYRHLAYSTTAHGLWCRLMAQAFLSA